MISREQRHPVAIAARMRGDHGWADISIRNVSLHGMLIQAERPPPPGAYLEVRLANLFYAVRTVWANGRLFGVRTRERIDLRRMLTDRKEWDREPGGPHADRRRIARHDADHNRHTGNMLQFVFLIAAAVAVSAMGGQIVHTILSGPLHAIEAHLLGPSHPP